MKETEKNSESRLPATPETRPRSSGATRSCISCVTAKSKVHSPVREMAIPAISSLCKFWALNLMPATCGVLSGCRMVTITRGPQQTRPMQAQTRRQHGKYGSGSKARESTHTTKHADLCLGQPSPMQITSHEEPQRQHRAAEHRQCKAGQHHTLAAVHNKAVQHSRGATPQAAGHAAPAAAASAAAAAACCG
eukprot:1145335-Pelagomonas_calceolata.AAC.7